MALLPSAPTGGSAGHVTHHGQLHKKLNGMVYDVVADYGADPTGVAAASSAIQTGIDAAAAANGGIVWIPAGSYNINTPLVLKSRVRIYGPHKGTGFSGTKLIAAAGSVFASTAAATGWEIDGLFLQSTGGPTLNNGGFQWADGKITNCEIMAMSSGFPALQTTQGVAPGGMVEMRFEGNRWTGHGAVRTAPILSIMDTNGGYTNANTWVRERFTMNDGASTQWAVDLLADLTNDFSYQNAFRDCVFEVCNGGCIRAQGQHSLLIENCWSWDTTTIAQDVFRVEKRSTGLHNRNLTIINSGRIGSPPATAQDFNLSEVLQAQLIGLRCAGDAAQGRIALTNCADVSLVGIGPSATMTISGTTFAQNRWPVEFTEISDPAAPSANGAKLYVRDNGAGKTQLVVRFPTGAIQVISTEP